MRERSLKMIGESASGMSDIGFSLFGKESKHNVVEDRHHLRRMAHAQLPMILVQRHITAMVESIFNAPLSSRQLQQSVRIGQMSRQTGYPIAHLRLAFPQGVGTLAFQLEHLSQCRPLTIVSKQATDHDRAFIQTSMPFLDGAGATEIHRWSRGSRSRTMRLEKHFNVLA